MNTSANMQIGDQELENKKEVKKRVVMNGVMSVEKRLQTVKVGAVGWVFL